MSEPDETNEAPPAEPGSGIRALVLKRVFIAQLVLLFCVLGLVIAGHVYEDRLGSFLFSFVCGAVGASLALMRRLRERETAVRLVRDVFTTLSPMLYGAVLAGVAYLLFMSGILTGDGGSGLFTSNLFPNFTTPPRDAELLSIPEILNIRPVSVQDFGKLLVWSFLAGYSEKFVVGILQTLEKKQAG